jgi:TonB family protein
VFLKPILCLSAGVVLSIAAAASAAPPVRVAPVQKPYHPLAYPTEAIKKGVEGNVIVAGEITPNGTVAGIHILASSSPLLDEAAKAQVSHWTFQPGTRAGRPVPVTLNAYVRFRKDRAAPQGVPAPGTLPAPIVGNLVVRPADAAGNPSGPEGFAVEKGDAGVSGDLTIDLPKTPAARSYKVSVEDVLPSGRSIPITRQTVSGGNTPASAAVSFTFHRSFDPTARGEAGLHRLRVSVNGRDAGGAEYRVAAGN